MKAGKEIGNIGDTFITNKVIGREIIIHSTKEEEL
jgi:hypothetical protein